MHSKKDLLSNKYTFNTIRYPCKLYYIFAKILNSNYLITNLKNFLPR